VTEHSVILDSIGGGNVLSCDSLGIKNIEMPYKEVTTESVKKTILDYKHVKEEDAKFDIVIMDVRPAAENYNEKRDKESREFKKNRNDMTSAKM